MNLQSLDTPRDRVVFEEVRSVPEVVNATFDFIRLHFRLLMRGLFMIVFPPVLLGMGLYTYGSADAMGITSLLGLGRSTLLATSGPSPLFWIVTLVLMLLGSAILIAFVYTFVTMHRETEDDPVPMEGVSVRDIWDRMQRDIGRAFGSMILFAIILVIYGVVAAIPLGLVSGVIAATVGEFGALLLIPLFFFTFFGILAATLCYFPLRFLDRRGPLQSFLVGAQIINGGWGRAILLCFLLFILMAVINIFFYLPGIVGFILEAFGVLEFSRLVAEGGFWFSLISVLGTITTSLYTLTLTVPLISAAMYMYSQTERKESRRFRGKIEALFGEEARLATAAVGPSTVGLPDTDHAEGDTTPSR